MQIDNKFTAFWMDTTTAPGTPLTGLSATITIIDTDGNVVVDGASMTELGRGWYIYTYAGYSATKDYVYTCNPGATAYLDSGVTDKRLGNLDSAISDIRGGLSRFSINYQAINSHTSFKVNEIKEEIMKIPQVIESGFNDTKSHIDVAKDELSDKIESIEIPGSILEEKEAKKALKIVSSIDKKLSSYIESEMKEKEEIGAISSEFIRQEMEDEMKRKEHEKEKKKKEEEEKKMEAEMDKKLLEEIKAEFDKQDEEEKEEKKKELEKELEETLKEAEEIKKELKTL